MPVLDLEHSNEAIIRSKYAQDLVRLANYIKSGATKSQLLAVCNVSHAAFNNTLRVVVEMMFNDIGETKK